LDVCCCCKNGVCNDGSLLAVAASDVIGATHVNNYPGVVGEPPMVYTPLYMLSPVPSNTKVCPVRELFLVEGEEIGAKGESFNKRVTDKAVLPSWTRPSKTMAFKFVPPRLRGVGAVGVREVACRGFEGG